MALRITEFFGRTPLDPAASADVSARRCPFVNSACIKPNHGACSIVQSSLPDDPVIACPNRLYAENYRILTEAAERAFGFKPRLVKASEVRVLAAMGTLQPNDVAVFGKYWGQELPLQRPKGADGKDSGSYYMDWILARLNPDGTLAEFTAVEVQTIDTTGSYRDQADAFFSDQKYWDASKKRNNDFSGNGFNWENVNKRILPQLIYKGHVLRRENKCTKGLFFVCPRQVLERVKARLGNKMQDYVMANSTITFRSYELGDALNPGDFRPLVFVEEFTTSVDEVARALTFPNNLPPMNSYETAITAVLSS